MEKEERKSFELIRTVSLLSDYLDSLFRVTILAIVASVMIAVPLATYLPIFVGESPFLAVAMASFFVAYLGLVVFFVMNRYRRRYKSAFDSYVDMIMRKKLMSDPEYERLFLSLRNELAHSVQTIVKPTKLSETQKEFDDKKRELDAIQRKIKEGQDRSAMLKQEVENLEKQVAILERRLYDSRRKSAGHDASESEEYFR